MSNFRLPGTMDNVIYGFGYVGNAMYQTFTTEHNVLVIDPHSPTTPPRNPYCTVDGNAMCIFVAVPSPSNMDGECDDRIVREVLTEIVRLRNSRYIPVCIKSTLTPDKLISIVTDYPELGIVYCPEFLRQDHAEDDFARQRSLVLGSSDVIATKIVTDVYTHVFHKVLEIQHVDIVTASLLKYATNSFLAAKVTFMNEMKAIMDRSDTDSTWDDLAKLLSKDERIGKTHCAVPGPDGFEGWGGACFPKDTAALIKYAQDLNTPITMVESAVKANVFHRLKGDNKS